MKIALLIGLSFSSLAFGQGPSPFPFWCQDLGLFKIADRIQSECRTTTKAQAALKRFAQADPEQYLPVSWANTLKVCQNQRQNWDGDESSTKLCSLEGPLETHTGERPQDILFMSVAEAKLARLPRSGVRAVFDTTGVHLQVSENVSSKNFGLALQFLAKVSKNPDIKPWAFFRPSAVRALVQSCDPTLPSPTIYTMEWYRKKGLNIDNWDEWAHNPPVGFYNASALPGMYTKGTPASQTLEIIVEEEQKTEDLLDKLAHLEKDRDMLGFQYAKDNCVQDEGSKLPEAPKPTPACPGILGQMMKLQENYNALFASQQKWRTRSQVYFEIAKTLTRGVDRMDKFYKSLTDGGLSKESEQEAVLALEDYCELSPCSCFFPPPIPPKTLEDHYQKSVYGMANDHKGPKLKEICLQAQKDKLCGEKASLTLVCQ